MITSDGSDRVSLHHNYLHSNNQRNPSLQGSKLAEDCPDDPTGPGGEIADSRWNLTYNWGDAEPACDPELQDCQQRIGEGVQFGQGIRANVVGAWIREGPDTAFTSGELPMEAVDPCARDTEIFLDCNCRILRSDPGGPDEIWCPGNDAEACPGVDGDLGSMRKELVGGKGMISCGGGECVTFRPDPFTEPPVITERPDPGMDAFTYLLNRGGALPPDHWDRQFRRQYRAYQGELAGIRDDCVGPKDECGDFHDDLIIPIINNPPATGTPWVDDDGDMIDDAWEAQNPSCYCLEVDNITCFETDDALEDCDLDGWTDLEEWLHGRAAALEAAVVFADEFEDWKTPVSWLFSADDWQEREGYLVGTRLDDDTLAEFDGTLADCDEDCSVSATLRVTDASGPAANARLLAWRKVGVDTFHAVSLKPNAGAAGQVVIERRTNGALSFQCTIEAAVSVDTDYDVRIEYAGPSTTGAYRVYFNPTAVEETFLAACGQGVPPVPGTVGVGSFQANVRAGRIAAVRTD